MEIPEETAGPYPGDGTNGPDVLEQSGVVRSDIRSSFGTASGRAQGVPMTLELTVKDLAHGGTPFAGVAVYVWHCNRDGEYSMYRRGITDQNYLRGVQVADAKGKVRFTSIFPACYSGRWPHIHFEVYPDRRASATRRRPSPPRRSRCPGRSARRCTPSPATRTPTRTSRASASPPTTCSATTAACSELATVTGSVKRGYDVSLTVGVDTRTKATSTGVGTPPNGQ